MTKFKEMNITVVRKLVPSLTGKIIDRPSHEVMFQVGSYRTKVFSINPDQLRNFHQMAHSEFERLSKRERLHEKIYELMDELRRQDKEPTDVVLHHLDANDFIREYVNEPNGKVTIHGLNVIQAIYGIERGTVKVF